MILGIPNGRSPLPVSRSLRNRALRPARGRNIQQRGHRRVVGFPVTARSLMTQEERQVMAMLGALEAIRSGTTTLLEISANVAGYVTALADTGLRLVLAENINDVDDTSDAGWGTPVFRVQAGRGSEKKYRPNRGVERWRYR